MAINYAKNIIHKIKIKKFVKKDFFIYSVIISSIQITFHRLTKVGVTNKFWLKLTDVKRYCPKVGHLATT